MLFDGWCSNVNINLWLTQLRIKSYNCFQTPSAWQHENVVSSNDKKYCDVVRFTWDVPKYYTVFRTSFSSLWNRLVFSSEDIMKKWFEWMEKGKEITMFRDFFFLVIFRDRRRKNSLLFIHAYSWIGTALKKST